MKHRQIILLIWITVLLTSASRAQSPLESEKTQASPPSTASAPAPQEGEVVGCDGKINMSQADRLAAIDQVISEAKNELAKNPESIKDAAARSRIGTFAAGAMDDETILVSLDRWCWADFYEARKNLADKDESAAFESALDWKVCLQASFPDRVDLAKPYLSCFPGNKKKSKSESKH